MRSVGTVLLVLALLGGVARAGDPKAAEKEYQAGSKFFAAGDYEKALDSFRQAYVHNAAPQYLLRLAQCHRQLGNRQQAIDFYEKYLTIMPFLDDSQLKAIEGAVKSLKSEIEQENVRVALEKEQAEKRAAQLAAQQPARATPPPGAEPRATQPQQIAVTASSEKPAYKKGWVWAVVGVTVAAGVGLGVGLGLGLKKTFNFDYEFGPACGGACR